MANDEIQFCPYCGTKIDKGANYCKNCGKAIRFQNKSSDEEENQYKDNQDKRKTVYEGVLHKCPNCGELIDSFVTVCPSCGCEMRDVHPDSSVKRLAQKLEKAETMEQKVDIIRNFYIPNTKEDICDFFIFATSNMNADGYDVEAWYAKLEQAYQKAKLSFGDTPEFQYLNQLYHTTKKQYETKSLSRKIKNSKLIQCLLLFAFGFILLIVGFFGGSLSGDSNSPFYMVAMVGWFIVLGTCFYAMVGKTIEHINHKDSTNKK